MPTTTSARAPRTPRTTSGNPFLELLASVQKEVETRLATLLESTLATARPLGPDVRAMVAALADLCRRGGKRLRPALVAAGVRAASRRAALEPALGAGVALELLQAYFLIHDDWMDGDSVRRGGPTVHRLLAERFGDASKGDASAILAGDYSVALALDVLARLDVPPRALGPVMQTFARMQLDAVLGQQLDLAANTANVETVYALKTGSYTVKGPLELGARLAGARPETLLALDRFARPLGIAFQLRDDLLGAFGEPERTGKPLGSDLTAGKRTVLLVEALRRARGESRRAVLTVLGNRRAKERDVRRALAVLEECGARARVEARIETLAGEARRALARSITREGARLLEGAVDALTARQT
ncbi:MAG: polyprenyl synthetase family protein [Pseudomonadota bacterium]